MVICTACSIQLEDAQEYKEHYKTEFHKHNVKRRAVNLDPLILDQFQKRQDLITQSNQQNLEVQQVKKEQKCITCNKMFSNEKQYQNHLASKKHKDSLKENKSRTSLSSQSSIQKNNNVDLEEEKQIKNETITLPSSTGQAAKVQVHFEILDNSTKCFLCSMENDQESLEENLKHMSIEHSFFIPDVDEVSDLSCLVNYLYDKVMKHAVCLYCESQFVNGDSTKQHMRDKQHCFMGACEDYLQFYADEEEEDMWEDGESEEESEVDQIEQEKEENQANQQKQEENQICQTNQQNALSLYGLKKNAEILSTGELGLPNKMIGHRNFKSFYKQHYKPIEQQYQIALKNNMVVLYNKLGFQFQKAKYQEDNIGRKKQAKTQLAVGVNNNKLMHYFRQQNPM